MSPVPLYFDKAPKLITHARVSRQVEPQPIGQDSKHEPSSQNKIRHQPINRTRKLLVIFPKSGVEVSYSFHIISAEMSVPDICSMDYGQSSLSRGFAKIHVISKKKVPFVETTYSYPIFQACHKERTLDPIRLEGM